MDDKEPLVSNGNAIYLALSFDCKGDNPMYFKQKSNVMYRNYGSFGYITDNRNFGYKMADDEEDYIGDKIVSESGAVFLSVLSRIPQSIDDLVKKICNQFTDVDIHMIKNDAIEFYSALEEDGFIVSGETFQECNRKDQGNSFKKLKRGKKKDDSTLQNELDNSVQNFFDEYFDGKPQLTSLHIEIISECNERCIHCYIPHDKKINIMEPDMFYNILEQCKKMNLLHLTISGGEPLAHKNFLDFIKKCNEYNFSINVLSNLTLLTYEIIEEMKRNPLLCVQTSLYSMEAMIHDAITQKRGSFEKTKLAILELIKNGIPVQISCPIMKQNLDSYKDVIKWGKEYNINVNSDYVIIAGYDHTIQNLNCRLSTADVREIINKQIDNNPKYLEAMEKEYVKKKSMNSDDYICSVCHSSICISENGNVYPCPGWKDYILANISETKLSDIWNNSEKVKYLRNLRRRDFPQCIECTEKEFCTMCMVRNANEHPQGNPLEVNQYFCEIAKVNKAVYFDRKSKIDRF